MAKQKTECFVPQFLTEVASRSYRSFYKWGDPDTLYIPSNRTRLFEFMRDKLGVTEEYFSNPNYALESVITENIECNLDDKDVEYFRSIVGDSNVFIDLDKRIKASINKVDASEIANMHKGILPELVDAVVCPSQPHEIVEILSYARKRRIKVVMKSTILPKECGRRTIAIDLTRRYNRILEFSEVDGYAVVEAGMYLPILENILNNAPENFGDYHVANRYTVGHFPLEYEECTLYDADNGYGVGRESSYYGRFDDIVMERYYISAEGKSNEWSEGAVLTAVKLKLTKYYPHNKYGFSFMFRSFPEAINAMREMMTKNSALPVHIRLSDPKETSLLMRYYMLDDTMVDNYLKNSKKIDGERCLLVGFSGGPYKYSRLAFNTCRHIAKRYKGKSMTGFVADAYADSKYREMYAREAIADFGVSTECESHTVTWSELPDKYSEIMSTVESGFVRCRLVAPTANNVVLEVVKVTI